MKKIIKNFRKEEERLFKKHSQEIMSLKSEMISNIQAVLIPGKVYELTPFKRIFWVDPGMYKIIQISHDGPISVGGTKISWSHLDIYYLQIVIETINLKKFVL